MSEASHPTGNHTFNVVRRGYDPIEVNQYLAQPAIQRGPAAAFTILRRGYAPKEVDEYIQRMRGGSSAQG
jgi:hypothetical protein